MISGHLEKTGAETTHNIRGQQLPDWMIGRPAPNGAEPPIALSISLKLLFRMLTIGI